MPRYLWFFLKTNWFGIWFFSSIKNVPPLWKCLDPSLYRILRITTLCLYYWCLHGWVSYIYAFFWINQFNQICTIKTIKCNFLIHSSALFMNHGSLSLHLAFWEIFKRPNECKCALCFHSWWYSWKWKLLGFMIDWLLFNVQRAIFQLYSGRFRFYVSGWHT